MKDFKNFINENTMSGDTELSYDNARHLETYINKELDKSDLKLRARIEFDFENYIKIEDDTNLRYIVIHMQISLHNTTFDIPSYFNKIKSFFDKFGYAKMVKASSTEYYDILLDFDKLKASNLFKSITSITKFNL